MHAAFIAKHLQKDVALRKSALDLQLPPRGGDVTSLAIPAESALVRIRDTMAAVAVHRQFEAGWRLGLMAGLACELLMRAGERKFRL